MGKRKNVQQGQDVYGAEHLVLCFGKALTGKSGDFLGKSDASWVALGYFDTLQVYSLPRLNCQNSWVYSMMAEDQRIAALLNGDFYFHPVHIMSHGSCEEAKRKQTFLRKKSAYLAVTFVQEREAVRDRAEDWIEKKLDRVLKDQFGAQTELTWAIYQTLNLSDSVILWKANSINEIFRAIQLLYGQAEVGDLHTVPAILFNSVCGKRGAPRIVQENIPRVISRYLVKDPHSARMFFEKISAYLPEKPFLTTGMEDLSAVIENVSTLDLQKTVAERLINKDIVKLYSKAFSETEIHVCMEEAKCETMPVQNDWRLIYFCKKLQDKFKTVKKGFLERTSDCNVDMSWLKVASELYNALLDMSRSAVEDGFCFLILESAKMFCQEVGKMESPSSEQIMRIQRFLRGWDTLMEQSMRMDGKFNQQPGFSPALCQIPSRLLELYLAFNAQCCEVICEQAGDNYQFCFLLVPKLCRRIKVETVFFKKPPCDRLLYVDVPSDLLYEPEVVMAHLCHEISHFCGESWRLREARKDAYLEICANELAYALDLPEDKTIEAIYNDLNIYRYSEGFYLKRLQEEIMSQCFDLLEDYNVVRGWIDATPTGKRSPLQSYSCLMQVMANRQELLLAMERSSQEPQCDFFYIMEELTYLFKECYADISMIYMLELCERQYLMLSKKETMLYSRAKQANNRDYDLAVERWAIVLHVVFENGAKNMLQCVQDGFMAVFAKDISLCMTFLFEPKSDWDMDKIQADYMMKHYHRPSSIYFLKDYLKSCYQMMQKTARLRDDSPLKEIRKIFEDITKRYDFTNQNCHSLIQWYRRRLLKD